MSNYKKGPVLIRKNFGNKFLVEDDFEAWLPTTVLDEVLLQVPIATDHVIDDMAAESLGSKMQFGNTSGSDALDTLNFFNLKNLSFNNTVLLNNENNILSLDNLNFLTVEEEKVKRLKFMNEENEFKWLFNLSETEFILSNELEDIIFKTDTATTFIGLNEELNIGETIKVTPTEISTTASFINAEYASAKLGDLSVANFLKINDSFYILGDKTEAHTRLTIQPIII